VKIVLLSSLFGLLLFSIAWYDDNIGYLGNVKHQIQLLSKYGYDGVVRLGKPLSDVQLDTFYKKLSELGTLDKRDIIGIRQLSQAKKAHEAFFKPRPFYNNPFDSLHMSGIQQKSLQISSFALQLMYPFLAGFIVWFLMKYFSRYLFPAFAMFWLEVIFSFTIDWIVAEVKKVVADVVNMIVRILTFGLLGGGVSVTMPNFQDYFNRWWNKYIQPMLNEIDDEYSCRFEQKMRYVAKAVQALVTPINKIYSWWFILKSYAIDIPYNEFKTLVLQTYPKFVERNATIADDLVDIDARFFALLKGKLSVPTTPVEETTTTKKTAQKPEMTMFEVPSIVDNRVTPLSEARGVCQVVK
jgi:hypothetical protein